MVVARKANIARKFNAAGLFKITNTLVSDLQTL
jgi:hypothetical protein